MTLYFQVRAVNAVGSSPYSTRAEATASGSGPGPWTLRISPMGRASSPI